MYTLIMKHTSQWFVYATGWCFHADTCFAIVYRYFLWIASLLEVTRNSLCQRICLNPCPPRVRWLSGAVVMSYSGKLMFQPIQHIIYWNTGIYIPISIYDSIAYFILIAFAHSVTRSRALIPFIAHCLREAKAKYKRPMSYLGWLPFTNVVLL